MKTMTEPSECQLVPFGQIDFSDPIFESLRLDYAEFDLWCSKCSHSANVRSAIVVRASPTRYAGIAILKAGEGPTGPSRTGLKISTFKVAPEAEAQGVADTILTKVFQRALELRLDVIFTTVLPRHEDLARYLELRGFRRDAQDSERGERTYVADITHPERFYSALNRLAFDILAEEYRSRSDFPGPSQESPEYLAGLLTTRLRRPIRRVLELGPGSGSVLSALGKVVAETVAVEISPRMAAVARERAPNALIVIADVLDLDFGPSSFDGVYAGAFLHLFPRQDAARLTQRIAYWTRPGGAVYINTSVSDRCNESIEIKDDYLGRVLRFRARWTEEQFRALLEHNGLSVTDRVTTDERERHKSWVGFVCSPRHQQGL
jgi:SAM-dependent methyltransferase